MEFRELRKATGMSQRKFASYFGIPRRTVENWDSGVNECSPYIINLMHYKLEKENMLIEAEEEKNKG